MKILGDNYSSFYPAAQTAAHAFIWSTAAFISVGLMEAAGCVRFTFLHVPLFVCVGLVRGSGQIH